MLARRTILAGAAAALAAPAHATPAGLHALAAARGLRFGATSDVPLADAPAAYRAAFAGHCGLLAPNLGWRRLAAGLADPNTAFAHDRGMALTGAHLIWSQSLPRDFSALDPSAARAAALAHIAATTQRFAGQVFSWNVINEPLDSADMLDRLGPSFATAAFWTAAAADPAALLVLNETNLEMDSPRHAARRDGLLRLLDGLLRDGAPVHAVGLQTHLRLDSLRFGPAVYRRFLGAIASRGLRILMTEMDVFDIAAPGSVAQRDAAVAQRYADVLAAALDEPAVASLVVWGLSDRYTWLTPATNPAYRRADGQPARPLPLDEDFEPKPAFAAIAAALRAAPQRQPA